MHTSPAPDEDELKVKHQEPKSDSSTIQLFSDILRGVGRNRLDGARKKGGFKVHAMMDAFSGVVEFTRGSMIRSSFTI